MVKIIPRGSMKTPEEVIGWKDPPLSVVQIILIRAPRTFSLRVAWGIRTAGLAFGPGVSAITAGVSFSATLGLGFSTSTFSSIISKTFGSAISVEVEADSGFVSDPIIIGATFTAGEVIAASQRKKTARALAIGAKIEYRPRDGSIVRDGRIELPTLVWKTRVIPFN